MTARQFREDQSISIDNVGDIDAFAEAYAKHVIEKALPEIPKRKRERHVTVLGDIWTDNATEIQIQKDFINELKQNLKDKVIEI